MDHPNPIDPTATKPVKPEQTAQPEDDNLETLALFATRIDSRTRCAQETTPDGNLRTPACDKASRPESCNRRK